MKRVLFVIVCIVCALQGFCQDPDLNNVDWRIESITLDGSSVSIPPQDDIYNTVFGLIDSTSGSGIYILNYCSSGEGNVTFNGNVSFLVTNQTVESETECDEEAIDNYELALYEFFEPGTTGQLILYTIEDLEAGRKRLILTDDDNNEIIFNNAFGAAANDSELLGEWYLIEYDTRLGFGDPVPSTTPQIIPYIEFLDESPINVIGNFGCRDFSGTFSHRQDFNSFLSVGFNPENGSCTDDVANDFEADFFEVFFEPDSEFEIPYSFSNDSNGIRTLRFGHPFEYFAKFQRQPLSVNQNELVSFSIFPNPVKNLLNITTEVAIDNITIYALNGQVLKTETSTQLDVSDLASGIYFVQVTSQGKTAIKRVVKE